MYHCWKDKGYLLDLPPPQATVAFDNDHFGLTLWGSGSYQYYSQEKNKIDLSYEKKPPNFPLYTGCLI